MTTGPEVARGPQVGPVFWPTTQAAAALHALTRHCGLGDGSRQAAVVPATAAAQWKASLEHSAALLGVELEPVTLRHPEIQQQLQRLAPAVVAIPERGLLLLCGGGRGRISVLGPDLRRHRVTTAWLAQLLVAPLAAAHAPPLTRLLADCPLSERQRVKVRQRLLDERLATEKIGGSPESQSAQSALWVLRLPPGAPLTKQLRQARLGARLVTIVAARILERCCFALAFALIGRSVLGGQLERGWLLGALLLLLSAIPLQLLAAAQQEGAAVAAGALLKRRLLGGALSLPLDGARREGISRILGVAIEADSVGLLLSRGALELLLATLDLLVVGVLLALSSSGRGLLAILGAWLGLAAWLALRSHRARGTWTDARIGLSQQLIEKLLGHRTRRAQQPPADWHKQEDAELAQYLLHSQRHDRASLALESALGRSFIVFGILCLLPGLVRGPLEVVELALCLWALLLAGPALERLAQGGLILSAATLALQQVSALVRSAPAPALALLPNAAPAPMRQEAAPLLRAQGVGYDHAGRGEAVLREVDLSIRRGERVLLEGDSGGGKSTLCAVLAGLREARSGLLLLRGLDPGTLGAAAWRTQVVLAPQDHENHILSGSLAFNLLLGRAWPPSRQDLDAAAQLCEQLGLGPVLARMPAVPTREQLESLMAAHGGVIQLVADALGCSRRQVGRWLEQYGVDRQRFRQVTETGA